MAIHFAKSLVFGVKAGDVIFYSTDIPHEEVLLVLPKVMEPMGLRPVSFSDGVYSGVKAVAL